MRKSFFSVPGPFVYCWVISSLPLSLNADRRRRSSSGSSRSGSLRRGRRAGSDVVRGASANSSVRRRFMIVAFAIRGRTGPGFDADMRMRQAKRSAPSHVARLRRPFTTASRRMITPKDPRQHKTQSLFRAHVVPGARTRLPRGGIDRPLECSDPNGLATGQCFGTSSGRCRWSSSRTLTARSRPRSGSRPLSTAPMPPRAISPSNPTRAGRSPGLDELAAQGGAPETGDRESSGPSFNRGDRAARTHLYVTAPRRVMTQAGGISWRRLRPERPERPRDGDGANGSTGKATSIISRWNWGRDRSRATPGSKVKRFGLTRADGDRRPRHGHGRIELAARLGLARGRSPAAIGGDPGGEAGMAAGAVIEIVAS